MARFDFQELVEQLPLVVYVDQLDDKSTPLYISPQIVRLMGYSQEEWLADPDLFGNSLHPDDRDRVMADIADRNATGATTMYLDYRLVARDGRVVWIRDEEIVVADADGRAAAAQGYMQDVTARRQDSIRLELLVGILSLAADETPPDEIVAAAAESLATLFGDVNVSYVERRHENSFRIRYTTYPGTQEFGDQIEWSADYAQRLKQGRPIVVEDVANEAWLNPIRDQLVDRKVVSFVDVPLLRNGELTGVLWFTSASARTWGEHEISVLVDVAGQLAIVLANADAREQRSLVERDLRNRDAILGAISSSAERFLAAPNFDEAVMELMRELGQATGVSGAFVFENVEGADGVPCAVRRPGWTNGNWQTTIDDPRLAHYGPAPHFPRWAEVLGRGDVLAGNIRDLPDDEREPLELGDWLSVLAVPIFVDGVWWGFIDFDDCERERDWSAAEIDALRAAAGLIAAAVNRDRAEHDLRRRDAILEAVSHGARQLVAAPSWRDAAPRFLQELGEASDASRAYLFENGIREDGRVTASQLFEWAAPGITPELDNPVMQDMCFEDIGLERVAAISARNELFTGKVSEMAPHEREFFEEQGIKSLMTVPIFVGDTWWGTIGFDDCVNERVWSPAKTDALRTAASLVGAAIEREGAERDLRRRDAVLEAVSRSARRLLAEPNWGDAADDLLQRLGVAAEASRAYIFEHRVRSDGVPVAIPRYEWVADGISPEIDMPLLQEVCFVENGLLRHWEMFNRNEAVAGNVADFPEQERALIASPDTLSIINLPIFVGDDCWGFIGLDDCVSQRDWSAAETDALRTAASLVAAAIARECAEGVLREHEQKLRAVFDTALDAIFITDDERRYVDVNPAGCELIGVSKRDLIGRHLDEFLPPLRLEHVRAEWAQYIEGGPVREEWQTMRPDGGVVISEASARPNFVPGLHIAFMRDITDRKRLETELLSAQKLESLGRLAGGVAHDFNNLLTGIIGYASLLLERTNGDAELARDLGEIKRAADRAAELTKQLLAFGRRQVLKPRPLDLNSVLAEVGGLLQRLLGDHVELELLPAPELGIVRADPGQIEQVIVNLAVNASDAMPHGGRLSIATRNAGDGAVELVVADTGIGMDEQTLARIFEPFFTTRDEGVGLGLASVYGIVHQSGGEVTVESTPGTGSVFTVRLPRILEPAAALPPAPEPETGPGSETILLVEDEDVVRELTRRVLERQGYTVLACADGEEAIALAQRDDRRIHLLLTDVVMPGLRGYEVARLVAASRPEIKILYMSGYAEEALVGRPALAESALIEKPFAVDALARRVREALEAA